MSKRYINRLPRTWTTISDYPLLRDATRCYATHALTNSLSVKHISAQNVYIPIFLLHVSRRVKNKCARIRVAAKRFLIKKPVFFSNRNSVGFFFKKNRFLIKIWFLFKISVETLFTAFPSVSVVLKVFSYAYLTCLWDIGIFLVVFGNLPKVEDCYEGIGRKRQNYSLF